MYIGRFGWHPCGEGWGGLAVLRIGGGCAEVGLRRRALMGRASLRRSSGGGLAADGSGRGCYVWNRGLG